MVPDGGGCRCVCSGNITLARRLGGVALLFGGWICFFFFFFFLLARWWLGVRRQRRKIKCDWWGDVAEDFDGGFGAQGRCSADTGAVRAGTGSLEEWGVVPFGRVHRHLLGSVPTDSCRTNGIRPKTRVPS